MKAFLKKHDIRFSSVLIALALILANIPFDYFLFQSLGPAGVHLSATLATLVGALTLAIAALMITSNGELG